MRILVVDDDEDARDLTEGALLSAGYTDIVTAASGWDALKALDVGRTTDEDAIVDVVLLDILMPEMDGVEVCARIRNDPRYADLPIIMVTALADMNSLANAFVAGATDYLTKPVNRIELVARVRAALRLKAELDRRQSARARIAGLCVELGRAARGYVDR
jgi:DNA-binding response OmpR family regulator